MARKALLAGALGYLVLPADLIPDRIPLIGGLDDLVVVVLAVDLFLDGVPSEVLGEKLDELGIERGAFDRDVAQIRRLMPAPVRRAIRRVPQAVGLGVGALRSTGIGPRVRAWITRRVRSREGHPDGRRRRAREERRDEGRWPTATPATS